MRKLAALLFLLALGLPAEGAEALRVPQPAYGGMEFYVYRPANMPKGWYMTYDGYAVQRSGNGLWYYGSKNGANIELSPYVVGSVAPSVTDLVPWVRVPDAPPTGRPVASPGAGPYVPPAPIYVPPYGSVQTAAYTPHWVRNPAFTAIRRWGKSVDRLGFLVRPMAPVAWKGKHPDVIYVWTGRLWHQITVRDKGVSPLRTLRSHIYGLTVNVDQSGVPWTDSDSSYLAYYAAQWGYVWMGPISLIPWQGGM